MVDPPHQGITQAFQIYKLTDIFCRYGYVSDLSCDDRAAANSNSHISQRKGGRIVNPVPDHDHGFAYVMLLTDIRSFVFGQDFCLVVINAKLRSDKGGNFSVISCQHDCFSDSFPAQRFYRIPGLLPERVGYPDCGAKNTSHP